MPKSVKKGKKITKSRSKSPKVGKARNPRPGSVYDEFTPSVYNGFSSERTKSDYSGFEKSIKSNEWGFGDSANRSTVKPSSPKKSSAKPSTRPRLPANLMASIHTKKSASVKSTSVKKSTSEKVEKSANKQSLTRLRPQAPAFLLEIADPTKGLRSLKSSGTTDKFKKELISLRDAIKKTIRGVPESNTELTKGKTHLLKFVEKIRIEKVTPTSKNLLKYKATFAAYVLEYLKYMLKNKKISKENKKILSDALLEFYKSDTQLFVKVRKIKSKPILSLIDSQDSDFNSINSSNNNSAESSEVRLNVNAVSESEK